MTSRCEEARSWVPRALMSDLVPEEEQALNAHLAECPACTSEHRLYVETVGQFRAVIDSPVPRHFFVYADERSSSVRQFWQGLAPGWKVAASVAVLTLAVYAGLMASQLQFRVEQGVYTFSFGRPLPPTVPAGNSGEIQSLRAELKGLLAARSDTDRAEWMSALRQQIKESNRHGAQQQQQWNAALAHLEARLNDRIEDSAATLTAGMEQSAGNVFRALQRQRQQDLAMTRTRLEHLAIRGELKEQETDEILSTLLQVARLPEK